MAVFMIHQKAFLGKFKIRNIYGSYLKCHNAGHLVQFLGDKMPATFWRIYCLETINFHKEAGRVTPGNLYIHICSALVRPTNVTMHEPNKKECFSFRLTPVIVAAMDKYVFCIEHFWSIYTYSFAYKFRMKYQFMFDPHSWDSSV